MNPEMIAEALRAEADWLSLDHDTIEGTIAAAFDRLADRLERLADQAES